MFPRQFLFTNLGCGFVACLGMCLACASIFAAPLDEKQPVPAVDSIAQARQLAQEIYKERWDEAQSAIQQASVARQVIKDAEDGVAGTANYYALLEIARKMAVAAGNVETAMDAIDLLASQFQLDDITMRGVALTQLAATTDSRSQKRQLVDYSLSTAARAIVGDRLDIARQMAELASREVPTSGNDGLTVESKQCLDVVSALQREYPDVQKARADLANNPKDPAAARLVGRYECFCKGEWAKGLPLLAQSDDKTLRELAARTLEEVDSSEKAIELGNAWWQVAEGFGGWHRHSGRVHAASLYNKVDRKLSGFNKQVVDKRLAEVRKDTYLALSERLVCKTEPEVKPAPKRNPETEDDNIVRVKGQSRADDWNTSGRCRQEGGGIRLFGGKSVLESKQQFIGDCYIAVRYKITGENRGAQQLWLRIWGECFAFERPEGIAELRRKGNAVQFAWTHSTPRVLKLKDPDASLPSTIKIHIGTRDIWNDKAEVLIPLIQLDGTAVR